MSLMTPTWLSCHVCGADDYGSRVFIPHSFVWVSSLYTARCRLGNLKKTTTHSCACLLIPYTSVTHGKFSLVKMVYTLNLK
jgi:hypothetical protein